jgi:hypothetical protein
MVKGKKSKRSEADRCTPKRVSDNEVVQGLGVSGGTRLKKRKRARSDGVRRGLLVLNEPLRLVCGNV